MPRKEGGSYEIRLKGHRDACWRAWFDGLGLTHEGTGTTVIHGPVADQAALHGLLTKVRDLGLPLVSVTRLAGRVRRAHHRAPPGAHQLTKGTRTVNTTNPQTLARLTGVLFLITYITSIPAFFVFYAPVLHDPGYITGAGPDTGVLLGAFLEVLLIIANIGTTLTLFPILKRRNEVLALGYVTARLVESGFIAVGILSLLAVVTLRQNAAGADAASLTVVGRALVAIHGWTFRLGPNFVVGVGNGLMLGYMMYRSALVPRPMAVLGLIGGPLLCASGIAVLFGVLELSGVEHTIAAMPEFLWELSLGIYLTIWGFRPSAAGSEPARTVTNQLVAGA